MARDLAHTARGGIQVLRADFESAAGAAPSDPWGVLIDEFPRFTMTAEAALTADEPGHPWVHQMTPLVRLAMQLADAAGRGPHRLQPDEERILMASPDDAEVDGRRTLITARALAAAGISWTEGERRGREARERAHEASRQALGELQVALLHAANDGDAAAVANLLARGANPQCQAFESMFDRLVEQVRYQAPMTPLALATIRGHVAAVDVLLANPSSDEATDGPAHAGATRLAALKGDVAMLERLLPRASVDLSELLAGVVRETGAGRALRGDNPNLEAVRLLVQRGARPNRRLVDKVAALLDEAGDHEMAAQLRSAPVSS